MKRNSSVVHPVAVTKGQLTTVETHKPADIQKRAPKKHISKHLDRDTPYIYIYVCMYIYIYISSYKEAPPIKQGYPCKLGLLMSSFGPL